MENTVTINNIMPCIIYVDVINGFRHQRKEQIKKTERKMTKLNFHNS